MAPDIQADVFIPARLDSKRLPRKQLRTIHGRAMLGYLVDRMDAVSELDHLVVLTTKRSIDDELVEWSNARGVDVFRGSEKDVLKRFRDGARHFESDLVVRANGDNPLLSPEVTETGISQLLDRQLEFVTGKNRYTDLPVGIGPEVMTTDVLEKLVSLVETSEHREHVTSFIFEHPDRFEWDAITVQEEWKASGPRLTVDTENDFEALCKVVDALPEEPPASWSIPMIIEAYRSGVGQK